MTRDWHAERYAAVEELIKSAALLLYELRSEPLLNCSRQSKLDRLSKAIAECNRTKNAP